MNTKEQAYSGYSLRQQLERLKRWCEAEGYEVLEEVTDPGQSGRLEHPGLDRVRDLVAAGGVTVVLAQDGTASRGSQRTCTCSAGSLRSTAQSCAPSTTGATRARRGSSTTASPP